MIEPTTIALCCLSSLVLSGIAVAQPARPTGKFYIVGMGTAPDLITVRAQRVIAGADIVLTEEGTEGGWADLIRGKELWSWPHALRRYYPRPCSPPTFRPAARCAWTRCKRFDTNETVLGSSIEAGAPDWTEPKTP